MDTSISAPVTALKSVMIRCLLLLSCGLLGVTSTAWAAVDIEHWRTENGVRVYFVAAPEIPMVDIRVIFDAGSAREGQAAGLAALTNVLLTDAAGPWSADQVAQKLEAAGAERGAGAQRDMAWVTLRSLSDEKIFKEVFSVFTNMLHTPAFLPEALERERNQMLVGLRYQDQSPSAIGEKAYMAALYGSHPYAHPSSGTPESVAALTREDVLAFFKQYYVAQNAIIAIVGDFSKAQAQHYAKQLADSLNSGAAAPALAPVAENCEARSIQIPHPSTQSHVFMGQPGLKRGDDDYIALYVGNHVLGGSGLVSRLNEEIREKRGLSYSIYSYFSPMRELGPFRIGLQTRNDQAELALQVVRETLAQFVAEGPTAEELEAAKKNITGGFPLRIDSNGKIAEYIAMIGFYDLPLNYLDSFPQQVEQVTLAQIKDAFKRRIHPNRMTTVVVGEAEPTPEAEPTLEAEPAP